MEKPNGRGGRPAGNTERSWCRAIPGGTGIAVLAILLSKNPGVPLLRSALEKLQGLHPVLRSRLRHGKSTNGYYFVAQSSPAVQISSFDLPAFRRIMADASREEAEEEGLALLSPLHVILEHELNRNSWNHHEGAEKEVEEDVMHTSAYELPEGKWVVALRLHVAACDRRTAVSVLEELLELVAGEEHEATNKGTRQAIRPCIEDVVPSGKTRRKSLFERGVDLLTYSVSSLRLSNLQFDDADRPRASRVVRLKLSVEHTAKILSECRTRGIKLCGVLAASALLSAYECETGGFGNKKRSGKKYGVVTLVDCRSLLSPPLSRQDLGFYHSAILNTYNMKGRETLWDTASKAYLTFQSSKDEGKHFADMADLNFLMCKAIDNPGLTPSSSLRTSLVCVFEDPVMDDSCDARVRLGVEDYMGCASVHGIGPSLAIFDTVRDGSLDCVCVFPWPLHSRERMVDFGDRMKAALIEAAR